MPALVSTVKTLELLEMIAARKGCILIACQSVHDNWKVYLLYCLQEQAVLCTCEGTCDRNI